MYKKIALMLSMLLMLLSINIFATQVEESTQTVIEKTIIDKLNAGEIYSIHGWGQLDTINKEIQDKEGFKNILNANGITDKELNFIDLKYGNIINLIEIDNSKIDDYLNDKLNLSEILIDTNSMYVELVYEDIVCSLMRIEKERIVSFELPNKIDLQFVHEKLAENNEVRYIEKNEYISGVLLNNAKIFVINDNGIMELSIKEALEKVNKKYSIDNPKIDEASVLQQREFEKNIKHEKTKKTNLILYSVIGGLVLILVLMLIIFFKKVSAVVD